MKTHLFISLRILLVLTILSGIAYPAFLTGTAQLIFPGKANGSLVLQDNQVIGSKLIGQKFDSTIYFWSRPSAVEYNPIPSAASNLGPANRKLKNSTEERRSLFLKSNLLTDTTTIPVEMIFASGSGLDPHISPEAALLQFERVTAERNMNIKEKEELVQLIKSLSEKPQFSLLGEPRINVFKLNLALDNIKR